MLAERSKRAFGFGCRDSPDIYNKFLEQLGFYRKHAATDCTSLFRVVSELQYDIQRYHPLVRLECVRFMRKNRGIFAKDIKHGYESYVNNIARPRTYGSLLELKALALRYEANIFLFEPLTHGKWFVYNPAYKKTWRIYVGRDNHFDAVYPLEYIQTVAECQSIVYQVLYKNVLGLPDVEYAVERMLHDPDDRHMVYKTDATGTTTAITPDGLQLELCKPGDTQCVLMYSHLCHFHNQYNFRFIEEFFSLHGADEGCRVYIGDYFQDRAIKPNPLLTERDISCVRQLLALGITPFPYKAAKSLDPCIYRNVEYDVWQEERLERISELQEIGRRIQNEKITKRGGEHANRLAMVKKAPRDQECQTMDAHYTTPEQMNATVAAVELEPVKHFDVYSRSDVPFTFTPYQVPQIYIPSPDPYAGQTFGIIPTDPNHLTFAENRAHPIGVQGCIYNPYPATPPLHFHATAQPALKHLPPATALPSGEPLVMADHITVVPHMLNQPLLNEYVMVDPTLQAQQLQLPYFHHVPQHQQQQQQQHYLPKVPPYQQPQQRSRPQRQRQKQHQQPEQQEQQQIASLFVPRCLFHSVPNAGDTHNRSTYENNAYTTHQPVPGGAPFWNPI